MDALHIGGESNELNSAFSVIFGHASNAPSIFRTLRLVFPILQYIVSVLDCHCLLHSG